MLQVVFNLLTWSKMHDILCQICRILFDVMGGGGGLLIFVVFLFITMFAV